MRRLRQRLRDSRISFFRLLRMRLPRSAQKGELLRRKLVLLKLACGARPAYFVATWLEGRIERERLAIETLVSVAIHGRIDARPVV